MTLQELLKAVDTLTPDELDQLHQYVEQRRQPRIWITSSENIAQIHAIFLPVQEEAANMTEAEINAAIDEAIDEVRRERKAARGY